MEHNTSSFFFFSDKRNSKFSTTEHDKFSSCCPRGIKPDMLNAQIDK